MNPASPRSAPYRVLLLFASLLLPSPLYSQGVTTAAVAGLVTDQAGAPLTSATVVAVHGPSGTRYSAVTRAGGAYTLPNLRVGGPYRVTFAAIGFAPRSQDSVFLSLGQDFRLDMKLTRQVTQLAELQVTGEKDEVLNAGRNGAATFINPTQVALIPSIKRSTRDLTRLDPRSDGNFSFAGRNWLYNNISLDGSYFNNPFGLDDPAPGGQTNAEPVPYDAVEQVQVSVAPFDVRQGGFTGANVNTVTKSGTNQYRGTAYTFYRNDKLEGNSVRGTPIVANPSLKYVQSGFAVGGPLKRDKAFFYVNAELERTDDPGTNFAAARTGVSGFGVSRVQAVIMDSIRNRMMQVYNYDPGPYEGYINKTDNNKLLAKLDWNLSPSHNLTFRYDYLDAKRDLGPHPFVFSYNNTGRGPNASSLPFRNSGYAINNHLHSFALELNSRSTRLANRFFASYNRFRDFREPKSVDYPTIEIGQDGLTYTTLGHEPFSIHNILDQDVLQLTDNLSLYRGRHTVTLGGNFEYFGFFNSFNLFRDGFFILPAGGGGTIFSSLDEFFQMTSPNNPNRINFQSFVGSGPFKGEIIKVGQIGFYGQDEVPATDRLNLTVGLRVDFPLYLTDPVDNPFSRGLTALDANRQPETVDQSKLPGARPLFSPRLGFNWNVAGERRTQLRGGTGIFTGRVPFVWIGNVISNPGANPNLYPASGAPQIPTRKGSILEQSFDLNAMDPDFKWPQVWTTDLAVDQQLPSGILGTLELLYGKDLHSVFLRNGDLRAPVRTLPAPDGRPYFGGAGNNSLNGATLGGAGMYVIDSKSEGHSINLTAQLRKTFRSGASVLLGYSFTDARNNLKSTEIASVLWQGQPVAGDPNNPELAHSEFGQRHRIIGAGTWSKSWSPTWRTQLGLFLEVAEGNRFAGNGGNRYSFIYSGDVNGDGQGGNDLIYIPRSQSEITFDPYTVGATVVTPQQQWDRLDAFIQQDKYLRAHRGQIAERFGEVNPWYNSIDLRVLQDFSLGSGERRHNFELTVDVLNLGHLINSSWGVRKVADVSATSPLTLTRFDLTGAPVFNFTGPAKTFIDDPGLLSRWRTQIGLRYFFQ
ncbi:MAG TPA: carboxypeptidase regulatory-like domain-containing protein [Gemmatimonadales bacterium]|nr:carboxypeptidase regulatory-like domain-containing protein [Gemmatimonadales bacterium]